MKMPREEEPALKDFRPANKNVPRLQEYGTDLGDAYWDTWVCNSYKKEQGSFINHDELRVVAEEMNHPEKIKVEANAVMLQYRADIGVQFKGVLRPGGGHLTDRGEGWDPLWSLAEGRVSLEAEDLTDDR